jgi:hypothetical protein
MTASVDSFGASRFPLIAPATGEQSAAVYDPGLGSIIGLVKAAIENDIGAAWRRQIGKLDETSFLVMSTSPIGSVLPLQPIPQTLTQIKSGWPVLAVYREGEPEDEWITAEIPGYKQRWSIDWIVGPIGPDIQRKIGHFWVPIVNSIRAAIHNGWHPAYDSGRQQFVGQFVQIRCVQSNGPGVSDQIQTEKGAGYYGGSIVLETVERFVAQSGAAIDEFNKNAYATPNDGYGDNWTGTVITATIPPGTPEPI